MADLGAPASYLTLQDGTPVLTRGGEQIGTVAHTLAAPEEDIFDGLVIDTDAGHRFVDAPLVEEIFERGVVLTGDPDPGELPEPTANAPEMDVTADDMRPAGMGDKLRRAWDLVSGNY
jgi:hypothetical protein